MTGKRHRRTPDAVPTDVVQKPNDWEKCISVAYLRLTGATQQVAAEGVGVGERTIQEWESCSWWPQAQAEARGRWLQGMDQKVMNALSRSLDDVDQYATTARWWADRRIAELAPPKVKQELTGANGGPVDVRDVTEATDEQLLKIATGAK